MGCLLSVCGLGQLACCAGSTVCGLFNCCMPSNAPKTMYSVMFFLVTLVGWIMVIPNVSIWMKSYVPFCWGVPSKVSLQGSIQEGISNTYNQATSYLGINSTIESSNQAGNSTKNYCDEFTGFVSVYRLMFATTLFFVALGVIMLGVRRKSDKRVGLHQGLWGVKFLILGAGIVGAFFIPPTEGFSNVWKLFGLSGAFVFLLIQFMLVIIFADDLAQEWGSTDSYRKLLFTSLFSAIVSIVGFVLYYVYYGGSGCGLHNFFISINLVMCIGLCFVSVLPVVQEHQERSGLLQSSLVTLYLCYLTWSALNTSPYTECKPKILSGEHGNMSPDLQSFLAMIIAWACVLYSSIRISSNSQFDKITGGVSNLDSESAGLGGDDDENEDRSNWSYFYFIFALGTLYMMMTLTNWYNPTEAYQTFGQSASSLWIKMSSSWVCGFLYLWTLIAPIVLGNWRDFD